MDFRISEWISGFQTGFLDFRVDIWIADWISGFQIGFLPTVYEISFVTHPSEKPQYRVLQVMCHTLPLCTCYGELYGNIAREENGGLTVVAVSL